jgi:hypothetical protein
MHAPPPDTAALRRYAVAADADPRTVRKVLEGQPVRGMVARRVQAVLVAAGLVPLSPLSTSSAV